MIPPLSSLDIHPGIKKYLASIIAGEPVKKILLISGKVGVGKTHDVLIAYAWAREHDSQPGEMNLLFPAFLHASRVGDREKSLLRLISDEAGYGDGAEAAADMIRLCAASKTLFIDDLGSERNPPPSFEAGLTSLIDQRTEVPGRFTIITTNLGEKQILERYRERNHSRLVGFAEILPYAGRDRRFDAQ